MRLATYRTPGLPAAQLGVVEGDRILACAEGTSLLELLSAGHEALAAVGSRARNAPTSEQPLGEVELLAPVPVPPSVRDFLSFEEHVRNARGEVHPDWYVLPVFYFSNPAAVHGPRDEVAISPGSAMFDFELEVAAFVTGEGSNLTPEEARHHIAGYTVMCDFSARDIQGREMALGLGPAKGKDGATSLGPWLVTADELEPFKSGRAFKLEMSVSVNGRRYGGGSLDEIYWSFPEMVSYASRGTRIMPGDVIGSGTVGTGCILEHARSGRGEEFGWLRAGDVVELEVELLGTLRHRIVDAPVLHQLRPLGGG
jgi:2-keto-4-pentenoate hydratase/2-oxohepta-3-ene-1,7-dioic acid hydratase in catechol pathway